MTVEIVEAYAVPEIFADEIAQIHIQNNVMRFCYWTWQMGPGGILQRTVVVRIAMPIAGVCANRPRVAEALARHDPRISQLSDMTTAH